MYTRRIRDVPVEVSDMESQPKPRKKPGRQLAVENNDLLQGETAPQPMDVDETFWVEEPVTGSSKKKVRQFAYPSSMSLTCLPVPAHLH